MAALSTGTLKSSGFRFPAGSRLLALLTLLLSLCLTTSMGWESQPETELDIYWSWASSFPQGYRRCPNPPVRYCSEPSDVRAYRLPGYPALLAAFALPFGDNGIVLARMAQSVLAAALVYGLARRNLLAGILLALTPALYANASLLMTELVFAALLTACALCLLERRYLWAAACVGAMLMTRGTFLLTVPLLALWIPRRYWLRCLVIIAVPVLLWTGRNAVVLHSFVPFSTGAGHVLYGSHNDATYTHGWWLNPDTLPGWERFAGLGEVEQDRALKAAAVDYILSQPAWKLATGAVMKLVRLHTGSYLALLPLAAFVLRRRLGRLALVLYAGLLLNTVAFWGDARFAFPYLPLTALAVGEATRRWPIFSATFGSGNRGG